MKHMGYWRIRLPWVSHSFPTFRERLPCRSVSLVIKLYTLLSRFAKFHPQLSHSAARGKKAEALKVLYANNHSIKVVDITDIIHDQFQDVLVGVDAVIHTASPLSGRAEPQETLDVRSAFETSHPVLNSKLIHYNLWIDCHRRFFEYFTPS